MVDIYVAGAVPLRHDKSAIISFAHGSNYEQGCGFAAAVGKGEHREYAKAIHWILQGMGGEKPKAAFAGNISLIRGEIAKLRHPREFADAIVKPDGTLEIRNAGKIRKALLSGKSKIVSCADARVVPRYSSAETKRIILQHLDGGRTVVEGLFCAHEGVEQAPDKIILGNSGAKAHVNDAFVTAHPQFVELFDKARNGKLSKAEAEILAPLSFSLFYGSHFVNARVETRSDALREFAEESRRWWLANKAHH